MRAVIYGRYSSDQQREESLDAQVRFCEEYALSKGYIITKVYADKALSGKSDRRPEFQKMIKDSGKGLFDVVLIHKYNRFARNMKDHVNYESRLNDNNVQLIAVAEDFGQGKEAIIMKSLMRALSEYYIKDLADEVRKGHKENALKALHNGGYAPFGYDIVDQQFVINEFEALYVRKMFDCAVNRKGFKDLVAEMESVGIKGKRGKLIKYPSIYEILRNERYTGTYVYDTKTEKHDRRAKKNAIRIDDAIPALIDRETWEKVQEIMDERKQQPKNDYMLKGLVYCGDCGAKMVGHISPTKGTRYFECSKRCGVGSVSMDILEDKVRNYIKELLSEEQIIKTYRSLDSYSKYEKEQVEEYNKTIQSQIEKKQNQINIYINKLGEELPKEVTNEIANKIVELKRELESIKLLDPPRDFTKKQVLNWLDHIKNAPDEQVSRILISKVVANKKEVSVFSTLTPPRLGGDTPIPIRGGILPDILFSYFSQYK